MYFSGPGLSIPEAAQFIGISQAEVLRHVASGELEVIDEDVPLISMMSAEDFMRRYATRFSKAPRSPRR